MRVPAVLDIILTPSIEEMADRGPAPPQLVDLVQKELVLRLSPWLTSDIWREVVHPPLSDLPRSAIPHLVRYSLPAGEGKDTHNLHEANIFVGGERPADYGPLRRAGH